MNNLGNNVNHEGKGKGLSTKYSSKDATASPKLDRKLSVPSSNKSNIPKSVGQIKYTHTQNRPQSSHAPAKDRDSDSNPETKVPNKQTSRTKSKTPLGNSSKTKRNEISGHPKLRSRLSIPDLPNQNQNDASDALRHASSHTSSYESSPSHSPSSPKPEISLEASDEIFAHVSNPDEIAKPPFTIAMTEPDENQESHIHDGRCSEQCFHSHLLASKKRPNKRPGQLRHLKSMSIERITTLNDYLSIYEERLGRVNNDYSVLMKDAQLKCDEMILQITARWEGLKARIEQDYEALIKKAESHRNSIVQELTSHENLQKESSTLYDICDLEEDNKQDLVNWVLKMKENYSDVLNNSHNAKAMGFLSEISIDSIDGMRTDIETQMSHIFKDLPLLSPSNSSLPSGIAQISNSDSTQTSNPLTVRFDDKPRASKPDNPRASKPDKTRTSTL